MALAPIGGVRRATLADVAAVARLQVQANREAQKDAPLLYGGEELSAPELALRLLEDLDDGSLLYVAERDGRIVAFALVGSMMVGDGGHLVELRQVYVTATHRQRGLGRQLIRLLLHDVSQRTSPPALRAWAPCGSVASRFLESAAAAKVRQRWKVGTGGMAVRGYVYGWEERARPAAAPSPDDAALA